MPRARHAKFQDQGFQVLDVACNQFAGHEPAADFEIANFGVKFPLTKKADVRGSNQHPLYAELTNFKNGILPGSVSRSSW